MTCFVVVLPVIAVEGVVVLKEVVGCTVFVLPVVSLKEVVGCAIFCISVPVELIRDVFDSIGIESVVLKEVVSCTGVPVVLCVLV